MAEERAKRKLSAILSADVKGYSRLMGEDELATIETLKNYREIMAALVKKFQGRVVDSPGDNVLTEFSSVVDALECSVEIQKELKQKNEELPENRRMEFRIGVNLGDVVEDGERIYGDGVNIAARVESLAEGGGICISGTAFDQIGKKLPLGYEYLGEQTVKNIEKPVRVYRVLMEPEAAGKVIGEKRPGLTRGQRVALAATLVVVVAALAVWYFHFRPSPMEVASEQRMPFPLPDKPSLAVLPFDNLSGDPEQDYLVDGLTENIITGLSKIPEMFVIARHSTFTYKGKPVKVQQVAEDLGVHYVLEGSMQRSGERLRVTAQLIDALKGHHVWSEKYDRKMEDLFAVQDDITLSIAVAMQVELTEGEQAQVRHSTGNLQAWSLAVKAHDLFETYRKDDNAKARELFKRAVEQDPNYTYAWTYLGWTHWIDGRWYSMHYNREESFDRAAEMARKALSIDDKSSDSYALLSGVYLAQRKYDEAVAAGKKAIALDPNSSENHAIVAITMQNVGDGDAVISLIKQAMRLDPYFPPWYWFRLGIGYRMVGRYEESARALKKRIEIAEKAKKPVYAIYLELATTYSMMGRVEEAQALVARALEINPKINCKSWGKAFMHKDPAQTERILEALRKAGLPETPPLPLPDKPSIAVLPFVNMSGDPKQEYLSDGITESIIMAVSKIHNLFVIARNSTFTYKGKAVKVQQVARELGVQYVLEGSVQRSGERLRITAQLIDALSGRHIWAQRYDRELKDLFAMQDDITMEVLTAMRVKLTEGAQVLRAKRPSNIEAALKAYEAHGYVLRFSPEANAMAKKLGEEVVAMESGWGEGYYILSEAHMMDVWLGTTKSPKESIDRAIELSEKAISLDDSLAQALGLLGYIYGMKREYDKSVAYAEKAVAKDPNGADAHAWLGNCLNFAARPQEAIPHYKKAMRLNPRPQLWYYIQLGQSYRMVGRYEEAVAQIKKSLALSPNSTSSYAHLIFTYAEMGREDLARAAATELMTINPKFSAEKYAKALPYKDRDYCRRWGEALRKAGLSD